MDNQAQNAQTVQSAAGPSSIGETVSLQTDFGEYELVEELGRGSMGVVYKARQKNLDRLVAIKVILTGQLATHAQVEQFRTEARAAAKLQHPNVVRIYEAGEVRGNHFFAMEFIAGQNLLDVMQSRRLEFEEIAELISTVARAVDHLHAQGVLHRDLKPSNVLLDIQGRPFVTDFGVAMMFDRGGNADKPVAIAGTPNYMAPEQAAAKGALIGPRTDVYGLGAVLFHLLTNQPPFQEFTTMDTLVRLLESEPPRPRQIRPLIPPELETICLRCLEKRPDDRYPSAAALADDLDRFLRGEAVESRPLGLWHWLKSWTRRQPALVSRLTGFAACWLIAEINYHAFHDEPLTQHREVLATLALWSAGSAICQWLLGKERWAERARWMWAATDIVLMTALLRVIGAANSALVASYGVAIAGAGLWLRERLVWLVTFTSAAGYAALVVDAYRRGLPLPAPHWHLVLLTLLLVLGWITAYQVNRIRKLGRYYRPIPDAVARHGGRR